MPRPRRDRAGEDSLARAVYEQDRSQRPLFPVRPPSKERTTRADLEQEWGSHNGPVRTTETIEPWRRKLRVARYRRRKALEAEA